jgi:hypothetical protein
MIFVNYATATVAALALSFPHPDATSPSTTTASSENRLIISLDAERLVKVPTTPHRLPRLFTA